MGVTDLVLPYLADTFIYVYTKVFAALIMVCFVIPYMLPALALLVVGLIVVRWKAMRVTN